MTLTDAAHQIAQASVATERSTSFPAEVIAGQAALESGWMRSVQGNNVFGWKVYPGCHGRQLIQTTEWLDGFGVAQYQGQDGRKIVKFLGKVNGVRKLYAVMDWFAAFPSVAEAFRSHVARLQALPRYQVAWKQFQADGDAHGLIRGIAKAGYSTAPDYADKVIEIGWGVRLSGPIAAARAVRSEP